MDKLKDRAKTVRDHFLYFASGGKLTPLGKSRVILISLVILAVTNVLMIATDANGNLNLVVWALLIGFWTASWIMWDPDIGGCEGPRGLVTSPSGEVGLGVCHGCESWILLIRGEEVGVGKKKDSLIERLRELALVWERNVPAVASDLRFAAEVVEEMPDLTHTLDALGENEAAETEAQVGEKMQEVMKAIAAVATGAKTVNTAADLEAHIAESDSESVGVIVDAGEYKKFCEWRESNDREEPNGNA